MRPAYINISRLEIVSLLVPLFSAHIYNAVICYVCVFDINQAFRD